MAQLIRIPDIEATSLELLSAAGFEDASTLATADPAELAQELARANSILKITGVTPSHAAVKSWIIAAREQVAHHKATVHPDGTPVDDRSRSLDEAPFAIPLPARTMVENQLEVADIPAAILLTGEPCAHITPPAPVPPPTAAHTNVQLSEHGGSRLDIDTSKLRSTENMGDPIPKPASTTATPPNDRVALIRTPRVATNKGRDPRSRWYIRGVLHSHPWSVYLGAAATLLVMMILPLAMIAAALLLASVELPEYFFWVPEWLLALPVALPVLGIVYLIFGLGGSCRICGQKLFAHRSHLKNSKAHHIRGLGYIVPLCAQILLFRWFRCTHCGTPVRLKE